MVYVSTDRTASQNSSVRIHAAAGRTPLRIDRTVLTATVAQMGISTVSRASAIPRIRVEPVGDSEGIRSDGTCSDGEGEAPPAEREVQGRGRSAWMVTTVTVTNAITPMIPTTVP